MVVTPKTTIRQDKTVKMNTATLDCEEAAVVVMVCGGKGGREVSQSQEERRRNTWKRN